MFVDRVVPKLLVSVRSVEEAREAVAGGAAIVDVKEPSRGPLGMASRAVWRSVREAVPATTTLTVALGELLDWSRATPGNLAASWWAGIRYCKVGLSGGHRSWRQEWFDLRERLDLASLAPENEPATRWVAVAYLDWRDASAPEPLAVIDEASRIDECAGILFDTWNKSRRAEFDPAWGHWIRLTRQAGRFAALAGSLDESAIRRYGVLAPDIFAVRGAACRDGHRGGRIDRDRVARLAAAVG